MTLPSNIINTATFRHFGNVIIANNPTILSPNIGLQYVQTKVAIATFTRQKEQLRDICFWEKRLVANYGGNSESFLLCDSYMLTSG